MQSLFDQQPYSVKRHGLTITNCDSEPVQTPGCVQAHGALLVLRLSDLHILQASDNSHSVLGHRHEELLNESVSKVIGADGKDKLRAMLDKEPTDCNPLHLLTLSPPGLTRPRLGSPPRLTSQYTRLTALRSLNLKPWAAQTP